MAKLTFTIDRNGGSGGTSTFYYNTLSGNWSINGSTAATRYSIPNKTGSQFLGLYQSNASRNYIGLEVGLYDGTFSPFPPNQSSYNEGYTYLLARWSLNHYRLTLDRQSGTGGTGSLFTTYNTGGWWLDNDLNDPATSVSVPTRSGYVFRGYYESSSGSGAKYVNADGSFTSAMTSLKLTAAKTIYAYWQSQLTLTYDPNGSGASVYPTSRSIYAGDEIGTLPTPQWDGHRFDAWYTNASGGTKVTASTTYSWTTDKTIYAHWISPHTLTFSPNGSGATVTPTSKSVYAGDTLGTLPTPTRSGYYFDGWYTAETGGSLVSSSTTYTWTADKTIYAHWTLDESYQLMLDPVGGFVSPTTIIVRPGQAIGSSLNDATLAKHVFQGWFDEDGNQYTQSTVFNLHADLTVVARWLRTIYTIRFNANGGTVSQESKDVTANQQIGTLPEPTRHACTFSGWYTDPNSGTRWTSSTVFTENEDVMLYAHWEVDPDYERTLSLNANGGTVSPSSLTVVYGEPIGVIPVPERDGHIFTGWFTERTGGAIVIGGQTVDWDASTTKTIYAHWIERVFGYVEDYFNIGNSALVPIHSDSGDNKQRICVSHTGRYEPNVDAVSGVWRNPSVTYMVVAQTTLAVTFGKAFAAQYSGTGSSRKMTVSGYMITRVNVNTEKANAPIVTISAVSNEGVDAVNATLPTALTTPFKLSVDISPRHRPQNLMGAIFGGGELQSCSLEAKCDPVVVVENQMPCASDVVHPKITVSATIGAYDGEGEPTATNGFTATAAPVAHNHIGWRSYSFTAEKTM